MSNLGIASGTVQVELNPPAGPVSGQEKFIVGSTQVEFLEPPHVTLAISGIDDFPDGTLAVVLDEIEDDRFHYRIIHATGVNPKPPYRTRSVDKVTFSWIAIGPVNESHKYVPPAKARLS